jgi:hypothetical protein
MRADLVGLIAGGMAGHAFLENLFALGRVALGLSRCSHQQKRRHDKSYPAPNLPVHCFHSHLIPAYWQGLCAMAVMGSRHQFYHFIQRFAFI